MEMNENEKDQCVYLSSTIHQALKMEAAKRKVFLKDLLEEILRKELVK